MNEDKRKMIVEGTVIVILVLGGVIGWRIDKENGWWIGGLIGCMIGLVVTRQMTVGEAVGVILGVSSLGGELTKDDIKKIAKVIDPIVVIGIVTVIGGAIGWLINKGTGWFFGGLISLAISIDLVLKQLNQTALLSKSATLQQATQNDSRYGFWIALAFASIAGALYPDGNNLEKLYDAVSPVIIVCVVGVIILLWFVMAITINDFSLDFSGLAGILPFIIAVLVSPFAMFANVAAYGFTVVSVSLAVFAYCHLLGIWLGIPYFRWTGKISSKIWSTLMVLLGIAIFGATAIGGWIVLNLALTQWLGVHFRQ